MVHADSRCKNRFIGPGHPILGQQKVEVPRCPLDGAGVGHAAAQASASPSPNSGLRESSCGWSSFGRLRAQELREPAGVRSPAAGGPAPPTLGAPHRLRGVRRVEQRVVEAPAAPRPVRGPASSRLLHLESEDDRPDTPEPRTPAPRTGARAPGPRPRAPAYLSLLPAQQQQRPRQQHH